MKRVAERPLSARRSLIGLVSVALIVVSSVMSAGPTVASTDLEGRWITDSLRDNRIGYALRLRPAVSEGYTGTIRFVRQNGRQEGRLAVTASVNGSTVTLRSTTGSFDRGSGALRGELSTDRQSFYLTNCQELLRLVMTRDLVSDCTFLRVGAR